MPIIQELAHERIIEALQEAHRREAPVALTCRVGATWHSLRSRILSIVGDNVYLEQPEAAEDRAPALGVGQAVGLSFKIKHHKHIFTAQIEEFTNTAGDTDPVAAAMRISVPQRMQRVQRRAYFRVDVPRNRSVLATFWEGGLGGAPGGEDSPAPSWEGWLTNVSAGGFQVRLTSRIAPQLDMGDVVGVRIEMGQEFKTIQADAQFRHEIHDDDGVVMLGFQFVGLGHSRAGRETLRRIGRIVCEFQRLAGRRSARDHDRSGGNVRKHAWRGSTRRRAREK